MAIPKTFLFLLASATFGTTPVQAATYIFTGNLSGGQEVPPVDTPGNGKALVTYDDVTNSLTVQVTFASLLGTTTMAHIHCCAPIGANAGVATPVPNFLGFPLGITTGSYSQILDLTQASSFNPAFITNNGGTVASARQAFVAGLQANRTYFNIHTNRFPGGEIRGQLFGAVPEPSTWAMMLLGFAGIGAAMRGRKAAVRVNHGF